MLNTRLPDSPHNDIFVKQGCGFVEEVVEIVMMFSDTALTPRRVDRQPGEHNDCDILGLLARRFVLSVRYTILDKDYAKLDKVSNDHFFEEKCTFEP